MMGTLGPEPAVAGSRLCVSLCVFLTSVRSCAQMYRQKRTRQEKRMAESTTTSIGSGTAGGLLDFLDYLIGRASNGAQVNPWKSAVRQVFTTMEGDAFESSTSGRSMPTSSWTASATASSASISGRTSSPTVSASRRQSGRIPVSPKWNRPPSLSRRRTRAENSGPSAPRSCRSGRRRTVRPHCDGDGRQILRRGSADRLIHFLSGLARSRTSVCRDLEKADAERLGAFVRTLVYEPQLTDVGWNTAGFRQRPDGRR